MNLAHRPVAAALSVAWGVALGETFACALPCLLGDWHLHHLVKGWVICKALGGVLIAAGLLPIISSFIEFTRAQGTPIPLASPPRLVIRGCYRYLRNPIYAGFLAVLLGQTLLTGSLGLLKYTAVASCTGAAAVRFYDEPVLTRRFGDDYAAYKAAVRAWIPRLHPWQPPTYAGCPVREARPGRCTIAVASVPQNAATPSASFPPRPIPDSLSQISRRGTRPICRISSHDPSSRSSVVRVGIIRPAVNRE